MTITIPMWLYWFALGAAVAVLVTKLAGNVQLHGFRERWAEAERIKAAEMEAKHKTDQVIGFAKSTMQGKR